MNEDDPPREEHRLLESRAECLDAIRATLAEAADHGCRELFLCDVDYAHWPLGERAVVESLTRWGYAHRRMTLLAASFDGFAQRHPRWVEWRRHSTTCDQRLRHSTQRGWRCAKPSKLAASKVMRRCA